MYKMFVEQVNDGTAIFQKILSFKDRDALQEAQNESIANWINIQGKYARIRTSVDGGLVLRVNGTTDREVWTLLS